MAAFTAQLPNVMSQLGASIMNSAATGSTAGLNAQSRATLTLGNKQRVVQKKEAGKQVHFGQRPERWLDTPGRPLPEFENLVGLQSHAQWNSHPRQSSFQVPQLPESSRLPHYLQRLTDPEASADFPPAKQVSIRDLDNRELDKLMATLGKSNATWRRALQLHEWLQGLGHIPDDRLCTTLMRVCSQHNHTLEALNLYNWMRTPKKQGGAGLRPSVYTYTGAMRAALVGNLPEKALLVWDDAIKAKCQLDCRICTTLVEVCTRMGLTDRALSTYELMRNAPPNSKMAPTVHAYTAVMRAAAEGGKWERALSIWSDMEAARCAPSGHAYAAAISACAAGGEWEQAVKLFNDMMSHNIKPDVVSCTALITALAADGQWQHAEHVMEFMIQSGVKPNVRTFTALITALGNDKQWDRALCTIRSMKASGSWASSVEPNAYTYSALLKAMGEQGEWQLAEEIFRELECEAIGEEMFAAQAPFREGQTINGEASVSRAGMVNASDLSLARLNLGRRSNSSSSLGSMEYGNMPTALAEEVLKSNSPVQTSKLPDWIPGQSNFASSPQSPASPFSFFSRSSQLRPDSGFTNIWTTTNAAVSGLAHMQFVQHGMKTIDTNLADQAAVAALTDNTVAKINNGRSPLNEVVCGAMMLAYERSGCWAQAVRLLQSAPKLGIEPNTIMYNTAISALGKANQWEMAEKLFGEIPEPDKISFETMIAAYGLAGQTARAEMFFNAMLDAGYVPRDYAFCGLIAAYSNDGDWRSAINIRQRMKALGCTISVHVYNALIAALERANQWDQALVLQRAMKTEGIAPDSMTQRLMDSIGKGGVSAIENQQVATTALAAAVAAAGSIIIRAGII